MSALVDAIIDVLDPNVSSRGPLKLIESAASSSCGPVELQKSRRAVLLCPERTAVPGMSASHRLFPLFNVGSAGLAVMCDYILFCSESKNERESVFVLLCELKSRDVSGSRQQIENGALLANYIVEMASYHRRVARPSVVHRGIVFSTRARTPVGNLSKLPCQYAALENERIPDLPVAHYPSGASYPLSHFCV